MTATERRRAPRFRIVQLIELSLNREEFVPAEGIDLSVLGLQCKTAIPLEAGERVYLLLDLDGKTLELEGVVAHAEGKGKTCTAGISFTDVSADAHAALAGFLGKR